MSGRPGGVECVCVTGTRAYCEKSERGDCVIGMGNREIYLMARADNGRVDKYDRADCRGLSIRLDIGI